MLALRGTANYHGGTVWTQRAGIHLQAPPRYYITVQHGQYLSICGLSGIDWLLDTMMMSCHSHSDPVLVFFLIHQGVCASMSRSGPLHWALQLAGLQPDVKLF